MLKSGAKLREVIVNFVMNNIIRVTLIFENPRKDYDYGCLQFAVFMEEKKFTDRLILTPGFFGVDSFRICRVFF